MTQELEAAWSNCCLCDFISLSHCCGGILARYFQNSISLLKFKGFYSRPGHSISTSLESGLWLGHCNTCRCAGIIVLLCDPVSAKFVPMQLCKPMMYCNALFRETCSWQFFQTCQTCSGFFLIVLLWTSIFNMITNTWDVFFLVSLIIAFSYLEVNLLGHPLFEIL